MDKQTLLDKVKKGNPDNAQIIRWVECLPGSSATSKPTKNKIGDVYMHPIFKHPYVLLDRKPDGVWICALLTSDPDFEQNLEACNSRFFENSYFTKTLFTLSEPLGSWVNVFDNNKQVKSVLKKLRDIFSA